MTTAEVTFKKIVRSLIREGIHPTPTKIKKRLGSRGKLNNLNGRQVDWLRIDLNIPRIKAWRSRGITEPEFPPQCLWNCCAGNGEIP